MTYLDTLRAATRDTRKTRKAGLDGETIKTQYEKNELNEKSPDPTNPASSEAEALKARIIATVTVPREEFDRAECERLTAIWEISEVVGGTR